MMQGKKKNICSPPREKGYCYEDPKMKKTQDSLTGSDAVKEQREYWDIPLIVVIFPESFEKHLDNCLRETLLQKRIQTVKPKLRKDTDGCYSCEFCGKRYELQHEMERHVMTIHPQEEPFTCDLRGETFPRDDNLRSHKLKRCIIPDNDCRGDELLQVLHITCMICKKVLGLPSALRQHMIKAHSGEKALIRESCDVQFHPMLLNLLGSTNGELEEAFVRLVDSCDMDVSEADVLIADKSRVKNMNSKRRSYKNESKENVNRKRASTAHHTVDSDKISSPDWSPGSTTTQSSSSSDYSDATDELPALFTRRSNNKNVKTSRCFSLSMASTELPSGSTLLGSRGLFRIKDKDRPFACGYCGMSYKEKRAVYCHIRYKHDVKRYSCEICGKAYAEPSHLAQHTLVHTKEKPFACDQCDKRFRLRGTLRRHKYTHSEERLFQCKKCGKSFKSPDVLSKHSVIHYKDQQKRDFPYVCYACKRTFRRSYDLKMHLMIHTGERPFKCSICDKQFRIKTVLQNHINVHSGTKRQAKKPCSVCGKILWAGYMSTHMRIHTGEKPFECNVCRKRFPKKQNLEGHMRSHTGEKPFACSGCDKRFALYSNMMTHKKVCTF